MLQMLMITVKICFNHSIIVKQTKLRHKSIYPYLPTLKLTSLRIIWLSLATNPIHVERAN